MIARIGRNAARNREETITLTADREERPEGAA